jgi:hypothetical protein
MKFYNCSNDHRVKMIDYQGFVNGLRLPLEGRRLGIVKEAFCKVNPEADAQACTMA